MEIAFSYSPFKNFKERQEIKTYLKKLREIVSEKNLNLPESFLVLPEQKFSFESFEDFSLILVCGIGGSSRGAEAIFEALKRKKNLKEILFLDSLNPLFQKEILFKIKSIPRAKIALFFVSKSGKTLETIANFFATLELIKKYQPKIFVISNYNSPLWHFGKKNKFFTFSTPEKVEGRYSVFSLCALLPLFLSGVDVEKLLLGARKANKLCLIEDVSKNPALLSANFIFFHYKKGKKIYANVVFPPDLEFFGKWYIQLMGESLGKQGQGITPFVFSGTEDFHSIFQLFFDGPRDTLINFVFTKDIEIDFRIKSIKDFNQIFKNVDNKKIWQLNQIIYEGLKKAYNKAKLPFSEITLKTLDEEHLGFLFQMKMIEILFLAKLMGVDPFGQPAVEAYKIETKKILEERK
jgi:glucose-6-phosphate isomerase